MWCRNSPIKFAPPPTIPKTKNTRIHKIQHTNCHNSHTPHLHKAITSLTQCSAQSTGATWKLTTEAHSIQEQHSKTRTKNFNLRADELLAVTQDQKALETPKAVAVFLVYISMQSSTIRTSSMCINEIHIWKCQHPLLLSSS